MSIFKPGAFPQNLSTAAGQNQPLMQRLPADVYRFPTPVYIRGEDVFCPLAVATAFGGPLDRGDSGVTASGIRTNRPGGYAGCSVPMPAARACIGTPFAQLPWKTPVEVTVGNVTFTLPLIDEGPSGLLKSQAILDITLEGWEKLLQTNLDPDMVNTIERRVSFMIRGVAKYFVDYHPHIPSGGGN